MRMVVVAAFVVMRMAAFRMGVRVVAVSVVMTAALVAVVMAVAAVLVAVVFVPGGQGGMKYLVTYEAVFHCSWSFLHGDAGVRRPLVVLAIDRP